MKKLFTLSLTAICITQMCQAQIKKGSTSLGGTVNGSAGASFYDDGRKKSKNSSVYTSIAVGKAVKENSVSGIIIGYGHNSSKEEDGSGESRGNNYSAGVFRTEYRKLAKDFYFFTSLSGSVFYADQHMYTNAGIIFSHSKNYGAGASLTPGVSYRLYRKLYLEVSIPSIASVQYSTIKLSSSSGEAKQNSFGVSSSLSERPLSNLGVGLRFIL